MQIKLEEVLEAVESGEYVGFCTRCGEMAYDVEPDARDYDCVFCGHPAVYGAEELLVTGAV